MDNIIYISDYIPKVALKTCVTCGRDFTICPPPEEGSEGWDFCLADDCDSYDSSRDASYLFD